MDRETPFSRSIFHLLSSPLSPELVNSRSIRVDRRCVAEAEGVKAVEIRFRTADVISTPLMVEISAWRLFEDEEAFGELKMSEEAPIRYLHPEEPIGASKWPKYS